MLIRFIILLLALAPYVCMAQETDIHADSLIYDAATMEKLKFIIDSMDVSYKRYEAPKVYYSLPQTNVHSITIPVQYATQAKKDIKNNISFEAFTEKYKNAQIEKDIPVYAIKQGGVYICQSISGSYAPYMFTTDTTIDSSRKWIFRINDYHQLIAFYLTENIKSTPLPKQYAAAIQYADYMIGNEPIPLPWKWKKQTFLGKILELKNPNKPRRRLRWNNPRRCAPEAARLIRYIKKNTEKPHFRLLRPAHYRIWLATMDSVIDATLAQSEVFKTLVRNAVAEALALNARNSGLEILAEKYDTKEHALQLRRLRYDYDQPWYTYASPVSVKLQIARLAAETANRNIFLRAHLAVLSDKFEPVNFKFQKDVSYTFANELEAAGIDLVSVALGISMRYEHPPADRYSDHWFFGHAMTESAHRAAFEKTVCDAIKDARLDNYNRLQMVEIYNSYIFLIHDKREQKKHRELLKSAIATLPPYLSSRITVYDWSYWRD